MVKEVVSKTSETEGAQHCQDDDLLSSASIQSKSTTPDDLIYDTISRPLALCIATVFEDLGDKLAVVGSSLSTPFADVRTRESIDIQKSLQPLLNDKLLLENNDEEVWILRQLHGSRIPYKLKGLVEPLTQSKLSVTEIMRRRRIKMNTQSECYQKARIQLHLMANALVSELILDSSVNSLLQRIETEHAQEEAMLEQCRKVKYYQVYIQEIQASIKQAKMQQLMHKKALRVDIHHLTDLLLEHDIRSDLEDKYVKKKGVAGVAMKMKSNVSNEHRKNQEYENIKKSIQAENKVHEAMMTVIGKKLQECTGYLDGIIDKYEQDFTSLMARLEALYRDKRRDHDRTLGLEKRIVDYERVVMDDRRIKEREAERRRKKLREIKKATKIQAWWRGTLVRKWLGPFARLFVELYEYKAWRKEAKATLKGRIKPKAK